MTSVPVDPAPDVVAGPERARAWLDARVVSRGAARSRRVAARRDLAMAIWRLVAPLLLSIAALACAVTAAFLVATPLGFAALAAAFALLDRMITDHGGSGGPR